MGDYTVKLKAVLDAASLQKEINKNSKTLNTKVKVHMDTANANTNIRALQRSMDRVIASAKGFGKVPLAQELIKTANAAKSEIASFEQLQVQLQKTSKGTKEYIALQQQMNAQHSVMRNKIEDTKDLNAQLQSQNKFALNLGASWKKAFTSFTMYMSVTTLFYSSFRIIGKMVDEVKELDKSLVELRKVTDLEGESLKNFIDDAYSAADAIGATGRAVVDATTVFARSGYEIQESLGLAKVATVMTNVGDGIGNVEDAATSLISALKAYNIEATEAWKVTDIINEVSNNAAINFEDLTEGIQRTGAVYAQAGVPIEKLTGLLTGANEVMQNIEKSSSGLITISQRLRGITELGDDGYEGVSKLSTEFKRLAGINIYGANGQLRDTYTILKEMSDVWESGKINENTKQYLGELAAGKRQINVLQSLLGNWQSVDKAVQSALDSEGSALEENEKFMDSIQGKMNRFSNQFQQMATNLIGSGLVKFVVDLGTAILWFVNSPGGKLITWTGGVTLALTAWTALLPKLKKLIGSLGATIKANPLVFGATVAIAAISSLINLYDKLHVSVEEAYEKASQDYEQTVQELDKLNNKLEETKNRIDELNNKEKLSLVEQDELNNLKLENKRLEAQNKILEDNIKLKKQAKEDAANTKYAKEYGDRFIPVVPKSKTSTISPDSLLLDSRWSGSLGTDFNPRDIMTYQEPEDKNTKTVKNINEAIRKYKELNQMTSLTDKQTKELANTNNALADYLNNLNTAISETSGSQKEYLVLLRDSILKVTNPSEYKQIKLSELLDTEDMKNVSEQLISIGDQGLLTKEKVDKLRSSSSDFDNQLKSLGLDSETVANIFNKTENTVDGLIAVFDDLNDKLDEIQSAYNAVSDAIKEYSENGYMSVDTIQNLLALDGQYLDLLVNQQGQLELNEQGFKRLAQAKLESLLATKIQDLVEFTNSLKGEGSQLDETATKYDNLTESIKTNNDELAKNLLLSGGGDYTAEEQQAIEKRINSIMALSNQISKTMKNFSSSFKSSKSSSSKSEKAWWEKQLDALKQQFDYSEITIGQYISGLEKILSKLKKGSDAWREVNDILQGQKAVQVENNYKRGTISLEQYISSLKKLIKAVKQGSEAWNDLADKIKKANLELLENSKSNYKKAYDAATKLIDDEIDRIDELRDSIEERYNTEIDAKKASNEETERAIKLAEAEERLANAYKEKNKRVYREGIGWVYESDQQEIAEAQKALDDLQNQNEIADLEAARDAELAIIDEQIEAWNEYKSAWADVTSAYQDEQNRLILAQVMGADAESNILNQRLDTLEAFRNKYISILKDINIIDNTASTTSPTSSISSIVNNSSLSGYARGGKIDYTGLAVVHGSKYNPEWVLNNEQMKNMISTFIRPRTSSNIMGATNNSSVVYNFDNLVLPNVQNSYQFLNELKSIANLTKNQ